LKYLIVFAVAIAALLLLKRGQRQRGRDAGAPRGGAPEPMHPCRHCGVHVPASRCVWRDGEPYCSTEHARLG
jgi:uncharacterized protein